MQVARTQAQQEVQKLQKEGSEVKQKAKELQRSLETEKTGYGHFLNALALIKMSQRLTYTHRPQTSDWTCA